MLDAGGQCVRPLKKNTKQSSHIDQTVPGLTKIATDNQPPSIVKELDDLSRAYIKPPHVVILAVSPANADIATSDASAAVFIP